MINTVRNTVLSVLNKNNYGYLSPSDFNLFAKQAQLDLFESYFYQYNYQINKENARTSGTGLADITKGIAEELNIGLDSMVFIDDNPTERELVRQILPEVTTPDFPAHPYDFPNFIGKLVSDYFQIYNL